MSHGIVIGLTGLAGSGKSTLANYLVEAHGFTRLSFAAPLKKMLRTLNPVIGLDPKFKNYADGFRLSDLWKVSEYAIRDFPHPGGVEGYIKDSPWGGEYRRLLQVLGTDCIRAVDDQFWVRAAMKMVTAKGNYVFDDVRFPNEGSAIYTHTNGSLWNIAREGLVRGDHESERYAGKMGESIHLPNNGTPEELFLQADCVIRYLQEAAA